ncbi:50S ribosomal protein L25 [Marinicrinis lubricantis]|uniref:Large ribosomal subunit protein bL25 n=1 Tax=Marinicrinis lubricantis TaxID=2086470 RepID=A0ABW1IQH5_9BACL
MVTTIHAATRDAKQTASQLEALRGSGNVPAVVYGKQIGNVNIMVPEKEIMPLLQTAANQIIQLQVDGKTVPTMIQQIQRDEINRNILHIDFHQIQMNEKVETSIPLHFKGDPVGVKQEGGMVQVQHHSVLVRCLPTEMPERIEVDIQHLHAGESLTAEEVPLPAGLELQQEGSEVIVTVLAVQKLEEEEAEALDEAQGERSDAEQEKPVEV